MSQKTQLGASVRRDLSSTENLVIEVLDEAPRPLSKRDVAMQSFVGKAAALAALNRLRERGIVERERSSRDARTFVYRLCDGVERKP